MNTFKSYSNTYKIYTKEDLGFHFSDGLKLMPRAAIQMDSRCPTYWQTIIAEAYEKGWLKVIAYQPVHEEFMEELTK